METLQVENLMAQRGIAYFSTTEGRLACDSVDNEFLSFIRAGLNQRERKLISLRTKTALARKKERGERIVGRPPYGWKVENGEMVAHEEEQYAITRMKALQAKGYSTREVVEALKQENIRTRKGTWFNQTQVCRILAKAA